MSTPPRQPGGMVHGPRRSRAWPVLLAAVVGLGLGFGAGWPLLAPGTASPSAPGARDAAHACTIVHSLPGTIGSDGSHTQGATPYHLAAIGDLAAAAAHAGSDYAALDEHADALARASYRNDADAIGTAVTELLTTCDDLGL